MSEEIEQEVRPCGKCRHYREAVTGHCLMYLKPTTRDTLALFRVKYGTCFEETEPKGAES